MFKFNLGPNSWYTSAGDCSVSNPEKNKQVAQLLQRDCTAGWVSYGQKWTTGTGRQYFTDIVGLSSITDVIG